MGKKLTIKDISEVYGALNDLQVGDTPKADRRTLDTTLAISEVVAKHFTADTLADKDEFLGVVLVSIPTRQPRLSSKGQQFELYSNTIQKAGEKGRALFYVYKVLVPELESRCLDLNAKAKGTRSGLSVQTRINTMSDVVLDPSLYNVGMGVRAIEAGTLVKVQFEDLARMQGPKITAIYEKAFNFSPIGSTPSNKDQHKNGSKQVNKVYKELGDAPGRFFWSGGASQTKATYKLASGESVKVTNGELENVEGVIAPVMTEAEGTTAHPGPPLMLINEAHEPFRILNTAFKARFGKDIIAKKDQSYRTYRGQVVQRMRRVKCNDNWKTTIDQEPGPKGTGNAGTKVTSKCKEGGAAAVPGQSNHGWGVAIDINRRKSFTGKRTTADDNECFLWLNKYAHLEKYGEWVYAVRGEKWHIEWMKGRTAYVSGGPRNRTADSSPWKKERDDPELQIAEVAPSEPPETEA